MSAADLVTDRADGSFEIAVHAVPGASRSAVAGRHGDALKIRIAVAPEAGRANAAIAELLADLLGVRVGDVELVQGSRHRAKRFRVRGLAAAEAVRLLDARLAG